VYRVYDFHNNNNRLETLRKARFDYKANLSGSGFARCF